jgi:hypothetical protein
MRLAWACSMAGQAILAAALWRVGKRDWWLVYLAWGVVRGLILWPLSPGPVLYWAWLVTEVVDMLLKFATVWWIAQQAKQPAWVFTGLWVAALASVASATFGHSDWPVSRQARVMLYQFGTYYAAGVSLGAFAGRAPMNWSMACYLTLDLARAWGEHVAPGRAALESVQVVYLWALSGVLVSLSILSFQRRQNSGQ